jgi:hypothetical protein
VLGVAKRGILVVLEKSYAAITLVLHVSGQFQASGLFGGERAEADALHLAGDFELDL